MIISLLMSPLMAALAVACGVRLDPANALIAWAAIAAGTCAIGAFLLSQQPIGVATLGGRFGFGWVRWGFRAGHGKLFPAAIISWLVWLVLGSAVITGVRSPQNLPIVAAWTIDVLGLFYIVGVMLAHWNGRVPVSLLQVAAMLVAMIGTSAYFWFQVGTDGARGIAVMVAGGPPLFVGAGYGLVFVGSLFMRGSHH